MLSNKFWEVNKSRRGNLSQIKQTHVRQFIELNLAKLFFNKMTTGSDNDFAEAIEEMNLEKFKM